MESSRFLPCVFQCVLFGRPRLLCDRLDVCSLGWLLGLLSDKFPLRIVMVLTLFRIFFLLCRYFPVVLPSFVLYRRSERFQIYAAARACLPPRRIGCGAAIQDDIRDLHPFLCRLRLDLRHPRQRFHVSQCSSGSFVGRDGERVRRVARRILQTALIKKCTSPRHSVTRTLAVGPCRNAPKHPLVVCRRQSPCLPSSHP